MLRIRTRGEKYQMLTSIKRATFECTGFIHRIIKKKIKVIKLFSQWTTSGNYRHDRIYSMCLDKDKGWCAERGIYDCFVSEIFQVSLTTMHLPPPILSVKHHPCFLILTSNNLVASLSTLLIWIQEYKFKHLLRTFF